MQKFILDNGLNIYYHSIRSAQSVSVDLFVKVGSRYENLSNNGVAHMLEHMHFRQLGKMDQSEIYFKIEEMGNSLGATTYKELTHFFIKTRYKNLIRSLEFFKEIFLTYEWTQEHLEAEKQVVLNQISLRDSYPDFDIYVNDLLWGKNSLAFPVAGTKGVIEELSLEELVEFKRQYYCTDNMYMIISGCLAEEDINYINSIFSKIPIPAIKEPVNLSVPQQKNSKVMFVKDGAKYLDVSISFVVDYKTASLEELIMLSSILGGGDGAKLCLELRERLGITSNIYSDVTSYHDIAVLEITMNIHKVYLSKGLSEILNVLNECKSNISKKDMAINIPFYTDNLWYWLEDPCQLNEKIGWEIALKASPSLTIENKISIYQNIKEERLMDVAKDIFRSKNASVVIAGMIGKLTQKEIKSIVKALDD